MCTHWFFAISQIGLTMRNAKYRLFGILHGIRNAQVRIAKKKKDI